MTDRLSSATQSPQPGIWPRRSRIAFGIVLVIWLILAAVLPGRLRTARDVLGLKPVILLPVSGALGLLSALGIGFAVHRRRFWRPAQAALDVLIGVVLILLGAAVA